MNKKTLLAFVLSMAVFLAWTLLFSPKPGPQDTQAPPEQVASGKQDQTVDAGERITEKEAEAAPAAPVPTAAATQDTTPPPSEFRDIVVTTDLYRAVFTESGGRLKSLTLNQYPTSAEKDSPPKELVAVNGNPDLPLGLYFKAGDGPDLQRAFFQADSPDINLAHGAEKAELKMTHRSPEGLVVERTYTFTKGSYLIGQRITLKNLSDRTIDDNLVLELASQPITKKERYAGFGAFVDNDLMDEIKPKDVAEEIQSLKSRNYLLYWAAYEDQYFMAAVMPEDREKTRIDAEAYEEKGVRLRFINPPLVMKPQTQKTYQYEVYYGPKDYNTLKQMNNTLIKSINFGWFDFMSKPLLWLMAWLYRFVGNYGVVIIIVTVLIKILFWPLTAKSYKSMKRMQKLQPMIMKLREKFKDDREAMNREMMQLYKTYKVNPLGGCLPMVIQIPVFIAFYKLLDYSLELRHAPFWLWITDLSAPDRLFGTFRFSVPLMEPPAGIPVLTLLMGASMLLQQKMTPTPGDPMQAKIMMFMPIFFTFIFINFPAGLVLYWLVNNILSIGQQTLINRSPS
ncbi:MAG: membrane protein insertase YidC [Thermodesulfobacteriota bacterium]